MNNKKRYLFGLISTLLFAVGMSRAAERFDPINTSPINPSVLTCSELCVSTCSGGGHSPEQQN
jgi:hypothetical protein